MGWTDSIATALGIACVALGAVRSVWTFPLAIASVALVGIVVWEERLYSDALLQGFFIAANLYGWWNWNRSRSHDGEVVVETMGVAARLRWFGLWLIATLGWGTAMHRFTDASYPWWDGGIAVASVAAQILMGRRKLENWIIWIAVDIASVPLYLVKGLGTFAGLYLVYMALSVWGLIGWRRAMREAGSAPV